MPMTRRSRTELLARRYLASRGAAPMVADPLQEALPRLRQEVALATRMARLDLGLATGLALAGIVVAVTALMAPLHGSLLTVLLWLHMVPLAGLCVGIWAAVVLEKAGPRLRAAQRIGRSLRNGAWLEALDDALRGLPVPASAH